MSTLTTKIGFLGAGQMASALASGFVKAGLIASNQLLAADPMPEARDRFQQAFTGANVSASNQEIISAADIIFLAVKPQFLDSVVQEIQPVAEDKLLVSIVAGIKLAALQKSLGTNRVIRVMPNTPCLVGQAAAGFCAADQVTVEDQQLVQQLLQSVGIAYQLTEPLLDAVTGLSGSGPAFIYILIEAMSDAGVRVGLPRAIATKLAAQTVKGAAEMVLSTGEHPASLKDKVASPGGTTIAGIHALEEHGFRSALIDAVVAATERSIALGEQG